MPNSKSTRSAHVLSTSVVGVLVLTVAFVFLSPATLLDVVVRAEGTATEFRPPENGPVVRVVVLDDNNAVGIEFTPDASAVINTMTCEQQVLYADTILAVWVAPKKRSDRIDRAVASWQYAHLEWSRCGSLLQSRGGYRPRFAPALASKYSPTHERRSMVTPNVDAVGCCVMKPMLDPERDLKGATPETLARALFRRIVPLCPPRPRRKAVVRDKATVGKVAPDETEDGASHLRERV